MKRLTILAVLLLPVIAYGWGVPAGTVITNAKASANNVADLPGEVVAAYTNAAGTTVYTTSSVAQVTTVVEVGYDMSVLADPADGSNPPGGTVDYSFVITNRGNASAQFVVDVSQDVCNDANWNAAVEKYEIITNGVTAMGPAAGPIWTTPAIAADGSRIFTVRVYITNNTADGTTNRMAVSVSNVLAAGGDLWPGAAAISPATPDLADARDDQSVLVVTTAQGPVIELAKSVSSTLVKPFETLTYQITYTNRGTANAYNLDIVDAFSTNNVRLVQDTAQGAFNTPHNATYTNMYYDAGWQADTYDDVLVQRIMIERVRWEWTAAGTEVAPNAGGILGFQVQVE